MLKGASAQTLFPNVTTSHEHKHMLCEIPLSGGSYLR